MNQLLQHWQFAQIDGDGEWLPCSSFPTTVHLELLHLKKIPDPFLGLNEWDVQWVGESRWAFKTLFTVDSQEPNADLVFEGVDTFASVALNGHFILTTSNQFVEYRVPVKEHLKAGQNELVVNFDSAYFKASSLGRELEQKHGKLNLWNGDSSRLHVRKSQYNYGWDWVSEFPPMLISSPCRPLGYGNPVRLHCYSNRITDLDVRAQVSESLQVDITAKLSVDKESGYATFVLKAPDGSIEVPSTKIPTDGKGQLQLWYPVHYGEQPIYTVEIQLFDSDGKILDSKFQKIGLRRVRVVQEKLVDEEGLTFLFEVNNIRIFCGGSNWIPADSFLTRLTPERYRQWLQLLVDGNQNMARVWGNSEFLSGKDFMFGCGQYPGYQSFLDLVQVEAEQNVKRLRHHPSISLKLELDYSDETSDFLKTNFPARHIYERLLPSVVEEFCDIYYHRGSPYSGQGKPTTDQTYGDIHQWNVWHGSQEPWHNWDILAGRFVSEFGMQGYPNIRTVDYWLENNEAERYPQSRVNSGHNKADGFERRLELYLVENFKHSFDMESYVYYTQIMQAETLAAAYRLWRRNWAGRGHEKTAGALVWQLNDCWPVTSWSIADYFLRPKPAYFTIARELRPYTVGMTRKDKKTYSNELSSAQFTIETILEVWGTNSTLEDKEVTLEVTCFDLQSDCWRDKWSRQVVLKANSSTELHKGLLPGQPVRTKASQVPKTIIVSARILGNGGEVLARYSNWPEPFKFIAFPADTEIKVQNSEDGQSITLSTNRPVKGIVLDVDSSSGSEVKWGDQGIDLVPDDSQTIEAVGLNGRPVKLRYLGDGTA
ncbi:glycoside hydrolase family 2 protein [Roridomyces roridus]|uniref:Beta-mannosidase B n=1 Tax=Roridomyces roridus TaxID=1738132 RepID=A0AAD7C4M9_9AGAR|nr:glycoside hydrolase family 2 protein [Roridomyces roridus]